MRAAIFLNGSPDSAGLLRSVAGRADLVIAADGGARYALQAGVVPDLVVGDMDSLGEELAREVERRGTSLERHPLRKDKMDGQLAVLAARERGATVADLLCAVGGRPGALFAVPHILLAAERIGLRSTVVADRGQMFVVEAGYRMVEGVQEDSISIFPLSGPAAGVTLEGMEYPLENASLEPGDTLGFHNELIGTEAMVSVGEGAVLVIHETEGP
ncbi:MAG: thiamine diphosphokinase [Rubrobacteraceae bacterium]|nr:thiamine diphosphokinase [Rubrobacteraceae bacterium]